MTNMFIIYCTYLAQLKNYHCIRDMGIIVADGTHYERAYEDRATELGLSEETMSRIAIAHDINNDQKDFEDLIAWTASRLAHMFQMDVFLLMMD